MRYLQSVDRKDEARNSSEGEKSDVDSAPVPGGVSVLLVHRGPFHLAASAAGVVVSDLVGTWIEVGCAIISAVVILSVALYGLWHFVLGVGGWEGD